MKQFSFWRGYEKLLSFILFICNIAGSWLLFVLSFRKNESISEYLKQDKRLELGLKMVKILKQVSM